MLSKELTLLKLIEAGGSISILRELGLTYGQIAIMLQQQEKNGNVTIEDGFVHLTQKGQEHLESEFKQLGYRKKETWILPQLQYYNEQISLDEIVLPPNRVKL